METLRGRRRATETAVSEENQVPFHPQEVNPYPGNQAPSEPQEEVNTYPELTKASVDHYFRRYNYLGDFIRNELGPRVERAERSGVDGYGREIIKEAKIVMKYHEEMMFFPYEITTEEDMGKVIGRLEKYFLLADTHNERLKLFIN